MSENKFYWPKQLTEFVNKIYLCEITITVECVRLDNLIVQSSPLVKSPILLDNCVTARNIPGICFLEHCAISLSQRTGCLECYQICVLSKHFLLNFGKPEVTECCYIRGIRWLVKFQNGFLDQELENTLLHHV